MWATDLSGGHSNSFGMTDQSFAKRIGMARHPETTWSPWVKAYSQVGLVGHVVAIPSSGPTHRRPSG